MAMEINNSITSQIMELKTSDAGVTKKEDIRTGYKKEKDYAEHLQEKYYYLNKGTVSIHGVPTTVTVSSSFMKKCMNNPEKAAFLEENLAAIPDCVKMAHRGCQGTITNLSYKIDSNGNMSVAISGSSDPDGRIARENAKRKTKEEKEAKERLEKKRAQKKLEEERIKESVDKRGMAERDYEISGIGTDLRSMTSNLLESFADGTVRNGVNIFDMRA